MIVERVRPTMLRVTVYAYELSALIAAAQWVVEGAPGELPQEARDQIQQVLENYDAEIRRLASTPAAEQLDGNAASRGPVADKPPTSH
jgi:hypothetical protein